MADRSDDAQLMARFAGGDAAAFEALYARYRGPLYRYFLRQCNHADAADELYEGVWTRVIGARARQERNPRFNAWLYQIAHNQLTGYFARSGRDLTRDSAPVGGAAADDGRPAAGGEADPAFASARWSLVDWESPAGGSPGGEAAPSGELSAEQRAERLRAALDALPIEQREAFLLHEEARLGVDDIATVTGASAATIRTRLGHAVAKLGGNRSAGA